MFKKSILSALLVGAVVFIAGCGPELPEGMPKLYSAKAIVSYDDGTTIPEATVLLIPKDKAENKDWGSGGTTGTDGSIELFTRGQYQGVPAGEYKVTVKKPLLVSGEPDAKELDAETYKLAMKSYKNCTSPEPYVSYNEVDPKYNNFETTPVEVKVEEKNGNVLEIKVGEKVHIPM